MCDTFLGIIQDSNHNGVSLGIMDVSHQIVSSRSFLIDRVHLDNVFSMCNKDTYSEDLNEVREFLETKISDTKTVQVLMEIPSANIEIDSIHMKMLCFLARKGYCALQFDFDKQHNKSRLGLIPKEIKFAAFGGHEVMYLQPHLSKAYMQFLLGSCASSECVAVIAALIATDRNLHYFLTSNGRVQSSQDVLEFMRYPGELGAWVGSGNEVFGLSTSPVTRFDNLEMIPLEYAVVAKKYEFLGTNDALKIALLTVCKLWRIRLHCISFMEKKNEQISDIFGVDDGQVIYDPQKNLGAWITSALQRAD